MTQGRMPLVYVRPYNWDPGRSSEAVGVNYQASVKKNFQTQSLQKGAGLLEFKDT
jgi:hypothetical protein